MRTIKLTGGDLGDEVIRVRCDLTQASAPVEVDYCVDPGEHWEGTQFQCADCRHRASELADIGLTLAAQALEMPRDEFDCEWEEVDDSEANS
jgi:hypothetical protein